MVYLPSQLSILYSTHTNEGLYDFGYIAKGLLAVHRDKELYTVKGIPPSAIVVIGNRKLGLTLGVYDAPSTASRSTYSETALIDLHTSTWYSHRKGMSPENALHRLIMSSNSVYISNVAVKL